MVPCATYKPAGGLCAVTLTPATNLRGVSAAADGSVEVNFGDDALLVHLPLAEQRSSYTETLDTQAATARVRHTLTPVVDREAAREYFTPAFVRVATTEGVVAVVSAASGERLLVGWSARFGAEQPLRLAAIENASGTEPLDGTPVTLAFESEDTQAARKLSASSAAKLEQALKPPQP